MKKNCIPIILIFFLFFYSCSSTLKAQTPTILGGEISYECIGLNTYTVYLNVYTDCLGSNLPDSALLDWSGSCQGTSSSGILVLSKVAGFPIDVTSSIFGGASTCNGGLGTRGVEQYTYIDTLIVPANCPSIHLSWLSCCRNDSLTSMISPNIASFYLETTLANLPVACNSSVVFLNYPVVGACTGFSSVYNQGAIDLDGDSLNYVLMPCLEDSNNVVNYLPGFSGTAPFGAVTPVTIDSQTGQIHFTAPLNQTSMFCVLVEEIRGGVVIGSTLREIAIVGLDCPTNNQPIITGIDSTNSYDTIVVVGQPLCFEIHGEDADLNQQLLMSWNNGVSGANFSIDTNNNPIGMFCWTPTAQDTGQHTFWVEVSDNAGPVPGVAIEQFTIQVNATLNTKKLSTNPIQNTFKVYPNPAKGRIQLLFDSPMEGRFDLKIIDIQGNVVQEQIQINTPKIELDISDLAVGLYSVLILPKEGQVLEQRLIVR